MDPIEPTNLSEHQRDEYERLWMAMGAINTLRAEAGSHVEILSRMDNTEAVYVAASWTDHVPVRFTGPTLLDALNHALSYRETAMAVKAMRGSQQWRNN